MESLLLYTDTWSSHFYIVQVAK